MSGLDDEIRSRRQTDSDVNRRVLGTSKGAKETSEIGLYHVCVNTRGLKIKVDKDPIMVSLQG